MVPPEAGERHTIGLAFALIIAQPKKRGKHARQIGCVEAASGKPKIPHSQSLPLEGEGGPKGRMRWHLMVAVGNGGRIALFYLLWHVRSFLYIMYNTI